jgi:hypothetical protein
VLPDSLRITAVARTLLPLDRTILGLDTVRLPSDGRVALYRPGDVVLVHHTDAITLHDPQPEALIDCGRARLARVELRDGAGDELPDDAFLADLDAGLVTLGAAVADAVAPLTLHHRVEDLVLLSDVAIDGELTLTRALSHDFPADETLVSSALIAGDLQARWSGLFEQTVWTGVWSDSPDGAVPDAQFNAVQYPLQVTNDGAITERWRIQFTNTTAFSVVGESVGGIAVGSPDQDCAPLNPATGKPFFRLPALGWGGGWSAGNCLRFNTYGNGQPFWLVQSISPGPAGADADRFRVQIRGDIPPS